MSQNTNSIVLQHNILAQNYYIDITANKGDDVETPFEYRQNNKIQYTVSIKWLAVETDKVTVEINRTSDMYVNGKSSDLTVANNIAIQASAALYPLVLSFDTGGNISKVHNYEQIKERWEFAKNELLQDFYGEGIEKYIHLLSRRLSDVGALIYALKSDCFLSLFFNNAIYTSYSDKNIVTKDLYFPYLQNTRAIKNTVTFTKKINDDGLIYISFDGTATDKRSNVDLCNEANYPNSRNEPQTTGQCLGAYFVNPTYNLIQALSFYYTMKLEVEKTIMVRVSSFDDSEKPVKEMPKIKGNEKIYIPINIYSDMEKDVQRHLNPLVDIKDMTRRERTNEGITIK